MTSCPAICTPACSAQRHKLWTALVAPVIDRCVILRPCHTFNPPAHPAFSCLGQLSATHSDSKSSPPQRSAPTSLAPFIRDLARPDAVPLSTTPQQWVSSVASSGPSRTFCASSVRPSFWASTRTSWPSNQTATGPYPTGRRPSRAYQAWASCTQSSLPS